MSDLSTLHDEIAPILPDYYYSEIDGDMIYIGSIDSEFSRLDIFHQGGGQFELEFNGVAGIWGRMYMNHDEIVTAINNNCDF